MLATLIIPQYRHPELTAECLTTLRRHDPQPWPVIVVDDGSPEPAPPTGVLQHDPHVTLITQPHRGLSAAWNRGAREARTEFLVFLNNDVVTRGPWLDALLDPLQRGAHLAGAALRRESALPDHVLDRLPATLFFEGWCFALRRELFHELGGVDERMRVYWSDTDLQCRLWEWEPCRPARRYDGYVAGLPLRHLGHRTVHDPTCLPQARQQWLTDRRTFLQARREAPLESQTERV